VTAALELAPAAEPAPKRRRKKQQTSPTARSLRELRKRGLIADVVERRLPIPGARFPVTRDLFNAWDIAAVGNGEFVLVQTTSSSNMAARIEKVAESPATPKLREANVRLLVHGWSKRASGRWTLREVDVS
jgi:hypothetical protein